MPPDPKRNRLTNESEEDRQAREFSEAAVRRKKDMESQAQSPYGRSAVEKSQNPTLAERILPESPAGQQYLRQGVDTLTSGIGGAAAGGIPGAAAGAGSSILGYMLNPYQAQDIGSFTNLSNLILPGASKAISAAKPVAAGMSRHPGIVNGLLGAMEGGISGGATAADTGTDNPGITAGATAALMGLLRGTGGYLQAGGRNLPASISPSVRSGIESLAEQNAGRLPASANPQGLLDTLTRQMSRLAPYIKTPAQEAEESVTRDVTSRELAAAQKALPKTRATLKAAETRAAAAEGVAGIGESEIEQAVKLERARSRDFLKSYPSESKKLETEIAELGKPQNRVTPAGQQAYDDAVTRKARLDKEFEIATRNASSEAALRENVTLAQQKAAADITKPVREADISVGTARAAFQATRREVERLAGVARSYVTRDAVRNEALDKMVALGARDPRTATPEARQAVAELEKSKGFSGQSLFEKTVEAPTGSEALSRGLMEFIGNDKETKAALRSRYVQHLFDTLQQGESGNVYGKTFVPEKFASWMNKISQNRRAFNNFMENPDAFDNLYALAEKLRKSSEGLSNPALNIHIGWGATGAAAYAAGRMVGTEHDGDIGGLLLQMGAAGLGAGAMSRLVNWKTLTNNILQSSGSRAKAIQQFLNSDDPTALPREVVKTAVRALVADSKPVNSPAKTSAP